MLVRSRTAALSLAVLLFGCTVPDVEYYDAGGSEESAVDTGAPDRTIEAQDSGQDVTPWVDASDADAAADSAADVASEGDSSDAAVVPEDATADSADALATMDSSDASETTDSADASSPDVFDAAEAQPDASATDAPAEATDDGPPESDGSFVNTCPHQTPPGFTTCCAHSPCIARQGNSCSCGECDSTHCAGVCCFDSQGAFSCVPTLGDCH
jgi:hypothetical protein